MAVLSRASVAAPRTDEQERQRRGSRADVRQRSQADRHGADGSQAANENQQDHARQRRWCITSAPILTLEPRLANGRGRF